MKKNALEKKVKNKKIKSLNLCKKLGRKNSMSTRLQTQLCKIFSKHDRLWKFMKLFLMAKTVKLQPKCIKKSMHIIFLKVILILKSVHKTKWLSKRIPLVVIARARIKIQLLIDKTELMSLVCVQISQILVFKRQSP